MDVIVHKLNKECFPTPDILEGLFGTGAIVVGVKNDALVVPVATGLIVGELKGDLACASSNGVLYFNDSVDHLEEGTEIDV